MSLDALVFPVGHCLGAAPGRPGATVRHGVRIGRNCQELTTPELQTWRLARGPASGNGAPWTAAEVASQREVATSAPIEVLTRRGLVAQIEPGGAERFARTYCVSPLLIGFGNSAEAPAQFGIGLPGREAAVTVDPQTYQLWLWGNVAGSLWEVCGVLAGVESQAGVGPPRRATDVLAGLLGGLRVLLAGSAAYLDIAR